MEKNLEIRKLADIVVWADNLITAAGFDEERYKSDALTAYVNVKAHELWKIKTVVLEAMNRHSTYTSALVNDIDDKTDKIELLEKELKGRKEGYTALKELMDTKYISIDEHNRIMTETRIKEEINEKEINRLNTYTNNQAKVNSDLVTKVTLLESENKSLKEKVKHQKENLDGINKTLEARTKEKENLIAVRNNQAREIEGHERENERLSNKIMELKGTITELSLDLDNYKSWNADNKKNWCEEIDCKNELVEKYEEKLDKFREEQQALTDICDELKKENGEYAVRCNNLIKELESTYAEKEADLKNHNRRDLNLVNELADKNDKIKSLVEEIEYYKGQEHIRTDQLRATESKCDELHKELEKLEKSYNTLGRLCKNEMKDKEQLKEEIEKWKVKFNVSRKETIDRNAEILRLETELKRKDEDHGKSGFEQYIKHLIKEEEGDFKKRIEKRLSEEVSKVSVKKTEEDLAKHKLNEKFGVRNYRPSEIDNLTDFLQDEVDKKRIVDVSKGVEDDIHVTRELLDAAIKLLVAKGYHEYYGGIPQATDATKYDLVHVLTISSVGIKDIVNLENIKSLDFDIPCGSDSIE